MGNLYCYSNKAKSRSGVTYRKNTVIQMYHTKVYVHINTYVCMLLSFCFVFSVRVCFNFSISIACMLQKLLPLWCLLIPTKSFFFNEKIHLFQGTSKLSVVGAVYFTLCYLLCWSTELSVLATDLEMKGETDFVLQRMKILDRQCIPTQPVLFSPIDVIPTRDLKKHSITVK